MSSTKQAKCCERTYLDVCLPTDAACSTFTLRRLRVIESIDLITTSHLTGDSVLVRTAVSVRAFTSTAATSILHCVLTTAHLQSIAVNNIVLWRIVTFRCFAHVFNGTLLTIRFISDGNAASNRTLQNHLTLPEENVIFAPLARCCKQCSHVFNFFSGLVVVGVGVDVDVVAAVAVAGDLHVISVRFD
jgi:hypothetical protein